MTKHPGLAHLNRWRFRADYMQGTRLTFRSKEDAIHFAEKQGLCYSILIPYL